MTRYPTEAGIALPLAMINTAASNWDSNVTTPVAAARLNVKNIDQTGARTLITAIPRTGPLQQPSVSHAEPAIGQHARPSPPHAW